MSHGHPEGEPTVRRASAWRARTALAVLGAVAAYFLFTEHRAHLLGALPYLLLLACPLMHLFMHGGHGGHGAHGGPRGAHDGEPEAPRAAEPSSAPRNGERS